MNIRDVLDYLKNLFVLPEFPRKRRADDSLEYFSPTKTRRIQPTRSTFSHNMSNSDIIDLSDEDLPRPRRGLLPTPSNNGTSSRLPMETIILDEDTDIYTVRRGNEIRFRRSTSRPQISAKYTSTPEEKSYVNLTNDDDDDDVIVVKENRRGTSNTGQFNRSKWSSSIPYLKPFTGASYLRSTQKNGGCNTGRTKENIRPGLAGNSINASSVRRPVRNTSFGSLDYSIRLDDKMQYKKLLEKAASNECNDASIYSTPVGKLFNYDTANASISRTDKIMAMAVNGNNKKSPATTTQKLSTKDTLKKFLDNFESDPVVIKDSDSESDVVVVSPPSPKPDIHVEPINSLKKVIDLVEESKSDWIEETVAKHKHYLNERQKEIDELKECSAKHEKINKDMRLQLLADRVTKALQLKEQVLPVEEEEEEIELPILTEAQLKKIERAFRGDPNEVLVQKFSLSITRRDMLTLAGLNWLNDEVINFYMNLIIERGKNSKWPKAYAFNTFFYVKLLNNGPQSLRRWTKKVDIFSHDIICVPIHLGMHWCMAVIDLNEKTIRYYDSMGSDNDRCLAALKNYLEAEHMDKKKTPYDTSGFTFENVKNIPQQMNGSDCGMFACTFAEFLSRNAKITFCQEHMPYLRKKMVVEILEGELLIK